MQSEPRLGSKYNKGVVFDSNKAWRSFFKLKRAPKMGVEGGGVSVWFLFLDLSYGSKSSRVSEEQEKKKSWVPIQVI